MSNDSGGTADIEYSSTINSIDDKGNLTNERKQFPSLSEFDSLRICNQIEENNNALFSSLEEGFRSLGESRVAKQKKRLHYAATVNFIDPTTKTGIWTTSNTRPANILQQQSMLHRRESVNSTSSDPSPTGIENVYEKLTFIFERDYGSTLRSVQYKNIRTSEMNVISSLPVRPTRHGSIASTNTMNETNTPWEGTVSTSVVSDPSEWHTGPFCHVYIAACESTEHYRTKIRPSMRAFVSQLESTASNTAGNQRGGHSADYLIVYIPTGDGHVITPKKNKKESSTAGSNGGKNNNNSGFFQKARQRFGGNASSQLQIEDDDLTSRDSIDSGDDVIDVTRNLSSDTGDIDSGSINPTMTLQHLSRSERALYKKISVNFPNGKVCVLSTNSLELDDKNSDYKGDLAARVQEWNTFNLLLGMVIVNGFQNRCRRYKDELKRLDAQRATAATAAKNYESGNSSSINESQRRNPYSFNIVHFFLVKESLACTYEQMQLPGEALLQYDEFRLYMPDLSDKEEKKVERARRKSKALVEDDQSQNLARLADSGSFFKFRKKIRTEYDLTAILDIMRRYLFARELSLLFRMEQPAEILSRCQSFIKMMYSILLRGISDLDKLVQEERKTSAARWVLQFSWDLYNCVIMYLNTSLFADKHNTKGSEPLYNMLKTDWNTSKCEIGIGDEKVASKLSEILEVSRLILIQLGDDHLKKPNPISIIRECYPKDLQKPWSPWEAPEPKVDEKETDNDSISCATDASTIFEKGAIRRQFLMDTDTITSLHKFEATYLKLCGALIVTSLTANNFRFAARIQAEIGEIHVCKGHFSSAVASFQKIAKTYRMDHWDRCHFYIIFRLAYCQRMSAEPAAYLKTLCSCFSPRSTLIAPKKALQALFEDLQNVIEHPSIGNARYSRLLFIELSLSISVASDDSQHEKLLDQKQVEKLVCPIGEKLDIPISIKSHLPGGIELSSVKLFVVSRDEFTTILANGDAVQEEDAVKILSLDARVKLHPGENNYTFEWSPSIVGHHILSTVEIVWKKGYFYYDSMDLQEPLLSIEVLPSSPSHSITVEPAALIPGQDQILQITINAGSDFLSSGTLTLSGTDGVVLVPPGDDSCSNEWRKDCEIQLKACQAGESQQLTVNVRCSLMKNFSNASVSQVDPVTTNHGLLVSVQTTYLHSQVEHMIHSKTPFMQGNLESFTPLLEKTALSVESVQTYWLDRNDRFMLSILLTSNSPYHFSVQGWEIKLAAPIKVATNKNINVNLADDNSLSDCDQLAFVFECLVGKQSTDQLDFRHETAMTLKLCDDDTGNSFSLELKLDLDEIYSSLPQLLEPQKAVTTLNATLELNNNRGFVGELVTMKFIVDNLDDVNLDDVEIIGVTYRIDCQKSDWIIAGKVDGFIEISESKTFTCDIFCIPVLIGVIRNFPKLSVKLLSSSGSSRNFYVKCQTPDSFQSVPPTEVTGIATPSIYLKAES